MRTPTRFLICIAAVVSLGGFVFGFDASVISGVVGFVSRQYHLDVWQEGLVVSAPTLAAIIGSVTVVPLSDLIGRKRMLVIVAALYLVSAVVATFATSFAVLIIGRAIGGLAFASLMITPAYIAEIAPAQQRGTLVSFNQLNIVLGLSAAYFSNYLLVSLAGRHAAWIHQLALDTANWRWMLGMEILPALTWLVSLALVPESPRWLVVNGHVERARKELGRFVSTDEIDDQIETIATAHLEAGSENQPRLGQIFSRKLRLTLLVGFVVAIAQQITGINAVFFFATNIFEQSGVGTNAAFAQAVWVGVINAVGTVLSMILVDRLGRRPLFIGGLVGIALSMTIAGWGFHRTTYELPEAALVQFEPDLARTKLLPLVGHRFDTDLAFKHATIAQIGADAFKRHESALIQAANRSNPIVVLIGILGFVASFAVSLGPVMWVLLSEIFPNHIRGVGMAVVGFVNALVSFAVQFFFPWELTKFGNSGTFFLYALFALVFLVLTVRFVPETKGRTLEELERELAAR